MKTNGDRQNFRRKNGHNCISERKFGDILDVLRANRDRWRPVSVYTTGVGSGQRMVLKFLE